MAWTEELTWDNSEEIPTFLLRKSSSKGEKPTGISTWKAECVLLFRWLFETCAISTDPRQRFASPLKVLKVRDGLEFHGSLQCLLLMLKSQKMRAVSWPQWKKKMEQLVKFKFPLSSWTKNSFGFNIPKKLPTFWGGKQSYLPSTQLKALMKQKHRSNLLTSRSHVAHSHAFV